MREHRFFAATATGLMACALLCAPVLRAQDAGPQPGARGQFAGMQRVQGEVTAVSGGQVTVKAEDGSTVQVTTTENTRLVKGNGSGSGPAPIKVADLKAGDGIMAMGNLDAPNKTLHAAMVMATDAAVIKKLREDLGKTYIAGRVSSIDVDNLKMTVTRADGVSQTIAFDEGTSFKRGGRGMRMGFGGGMGQGAGARPGGGGQRPPVTSASAEGESITLADIKVGDNVMGQGALKNGTFVPSQLNVMTPRARRAEGNGTAGTPAPAAEPKP